MENQWASCSGVARSRSRQRSRITGGAGRARVARGEDPVEARTTAHRVPTLSEAFREYLEANPDRKEQTARFYRALMRNCFDDWLTQPLDTIARREVEARFHLVSKRRGRTTGNHAMSLLRSVYRRPCVVLRIDETKTGEPLVLPITRQLAAILARRRADCLGERRDGAADPAGARPNGWVFPSPTSASGHAEELFHLYARISRAAGTKFWFHGLRNAFISVAERELMLPRSLTKRLVNHTRSADVTEGYAADWTIRQLREPAQRIADRIEELMDAEVEEDVEAGAEWNGMGPSGWPSA